jgi:hypothetical protein
MQSFMATQNYININIYYISIFTILNVADYELKDRGFRVRVPVESRIFTFPQRPDLLWGPPNLLFNGYRMPFPRP